MSNDLGMYGRYARDLSESLFNSVYGDLMALAKREQEMVWANCGKTTAQRRKAYRIGEAQQTLSGFCKGEVSLGDAMHFTRRFLPACSY